MKLHVLLDTLKGFSIIPEENPEITSIEMDSRLVQEGSLFICIEGFTVDGHDFVEQAVKNGAAAIVAQKNIEAAVPVVQVRDTTRAMAILADAFYGHPTKQMHLIGITGTNGKTSTSYLVEQMMRGAGKSTGVIGTIGMKINDETFEVKNTTPDSLTLQKMFHQMNEKQVETAVMEVSSHALHMGRVHGCQYDVSVFTNLTQDHLDYHKTMDAYRNAKSLLFSQLGNGFDSDRPKYAILNIDDEATKEYIISTQAIVITYGIDNDSDIMAKDIEMTSSGTRFTLVVGAESRTVQMKLVGKFNVYNVLAAVGASLVSGVELDNIIETIGNLRGVSGRFELVDEGQDFAVIVDYAHTPDSLENVLRTIGQFAKGKIYCVVGCGGDRDKTKRPIMAKLAEQHADFPIFTSDNPRSEDPVSILKEMEAGVEGTAFETILDRKEAIDYAISKAKAGDVILIAGKGHETYQIIGDKVHDFDDHLVAKEAILKKQ